MATSETPGPIKPESTITDSSPPLNSETATDTKKKDRRHRWQANPNLLRDPLLACLDILAQIHQKSFTQQAVTAGLPLVDHKLTPDLFVRAAERVGLAAEVVTMPLKKIKDSILPIILLQPNQQALVLLRIRNNGNMEVLSPTVSLESKELPPSELEKLYTGRVILIKPMFKFSNRAEETIKAKRHHWFWSVLWKTWPAYQEVLLASFFINCFGLAIPLFTMNIYDRVVPNSAVDTLWVLAVGVIFVFLFEFVLRTLRGYLIDVTGKKVDLNLSARIFEQVLGLTMASRPGSTGAFANTVQGFEAFREFITSSTVTVLVDLPFVAIYLTVIAILGGTLALIPLIMVPLVILAGYGLQLPMHKISQDSYKYSAEKQATLIETLSTMETIKSRSAESAVQRRWEQLVGLAGKAGVRLRLIANSSLNFSIFAQELASVLIVIYGVYKISNNEITVGALIACTILVGRGLAPMSQVAAILTRYHQSMQSLEALNKVMEMPTERVEGRVPLHRPDIKGSIQFREVSFRYPNQKLMALNRFSLNIQAGERVGILGRIGSGKTTLAKLILGLYQPTYGLVMVDGTELQQIDPADLRHSIGYVSQDIMLVYGSVRDNITLGSPYVSEETILKAAQISGVDRFVSLNPDGYDWQVGEHGAYLSGGQRQSIAIARAILMDPPILLMDEPTNNMDSMTEEMLRKSFEPYVQGKTLVLMTHKPSLLSLITRLIILDNGRLVADGPRDEVLKALVGGGIKVPSP